jgi:hypothetical protein
VNAFFPVRQVSLPGLQIAGMLEDELVFLIVVMIGNGVLAAL